MISRFQKEKRREGPHSPLKQYNLETHTSLMLTAHVSATKASYMVACSSMGGLVMGSLAVYPVELSIFWSGEQKHLESPSRSLCHALP